MKLWKLIKKMCFKKQRWFEVRRIPVGLERPAIERGWRGARMAEYAGKNTPRAT